MSTDANNELVLSDAHNC